MHDGNSVSVDVSLQQSCSITLAPMQSPIPQLAISNSSPKKEEVASILITLSHHHYRQHRQQEQEE